MKRTLLSIVICVITSVCAYSQDYNSSQKALIRSVQEFLNDEGYHPEKQDDGLKFTQKGVSFFVEVSAEDSDPMYMRLRRYIRYDSKITKKYVSNHINEFDSRYGVNVLCGEKALILSAEMYVNTPEDFTSSFDVLMHQLISASEKVIK